MERDVSVVYALRVAEGSSLNTGSCELQMYLVAGVRVRHGQRVCSLLPHDDDVRHIAARQFTARAFFALWSWRSPLPSSPIR